MEDIGLERVPAALGGTPSNQTTLCRSRSEHFFRANPAKSAIQWQAITACNQSQLRWHAPIQGTVATCLLTWLCMNLSCGKSSSSKRRRRIGPVGTLGLEGDRIWVPGLDSFLPADKLTDYSRHPAAHSHQPPGVGPSPSFAWLTERSLFWRFKPSIARPS